MELNKKAIVFTSVVLIFTFVIMSTYLFMYRSPLDIELGVAELKVRNTNYFLSQLDRYLSATLIFTGQRAIERTINVSIEENLFIENYTEELINCMYFGNFTHNATTFDCEEEEHLFYNIELLQNLTRDNLNIDFEISNVELSITQQNPWFVYIQMSYHVNVGDGFANWSVSRSTSGSVSIIGFRDLTYEIVDHTRSTMKYSNEFRRGGQAPGRWREQINDLNIFVKEGSYIFHSQGVSFLNRMAGNTSPGNHPILSLVNPNNLTGGYVEHPHMDVYFWRDTCPSYNLVMLDYSSADTGYLELSNITVGEGSDRLIITETLADHTNNTNESYRSLWTCP